MLGICFGLRASAAAEPSVTVAVDPAKALGPVQRLIFGHNVEAADPKDIFGSVSNPIMGQTGDGMWDPRLRRPVPEALALMKEIGVTMMRYPGGCLVHNFNWKSAVGPAAERPNFTFGVDELIELCRQLGAEPLMNVSAYVGGPAEAAELVEYLNAPADAAHPWAQKRAAWGHAHPFGVKYFEMGNESDHGNHNVKPFRKHTPQSYAQWFNDCADRMRAVDPAVRIGALMGTGTGPGDPWNRHVLAATKGRADFIIVHTYVVGMWNPDGKNPLLDKGDLLMRACMAAGDQTETMLDEYRALIRQAAGKDLPLAITEYNASFVQEKPMPYRFTFGGALFAADYLRILLKPRTNVLMANYWHVVNGYWGMLRGPRVPGPQAGEWKKLPAWYLFRLWAQHFGPRLVGVEVGSPELEFEGCLHVRPARRGGGQQADAGFAVTAPGLAGKAANWKPTGKQSLTVTLDQYQAETYHTLGSVEARGGCTYRISHEGRTVGAKAPDVTVGLDLIDSRGWPATNSGCATHGVQAAEDWKAFSATLVTLSDCRGLDVHLRLLGKAGQPASGTFEVRNVRVERLADPPPYAALTASASLSADGRTLYVIVFNKHHADEIAARVAVADGSAAAAKAWTVTGPSLLATNLGGPEVGETVSGQAVGGVTGAGFEWKFPARSMTAFEIRRR